MPDTDTPERVVYVEKPRSDEPKGWHLDRKVPLTFVTVVICNLIGGVWFAAQTSSNISDHQKRIVALEARTDDHSRNLNTLMLDVRDRLARLETRLDGFRQSQTSTPAR